ncbi:MAG: ribonuclease H-like domain-containing protein [Candidatus Dormiibacterota bacterium]
MTSQLRLKIEALQGGRAWRRAAESVGELSLGPRVTSQSDSRQHRHTLEELGFNWDTSRSLWARTDNFSLSDLELTAEVLAPDALQSLSPVATDGLDGPVVCFDLETTGLQRGTGTVPFLYGWAVAAGNGIRVEQWFLEDLDREGPLVEAAVEMLKHAGLLVTYNGASFDVPLLRTRAVMTGLERPWPATAHLDLLPLVRRLFRHRLTRCSLRRAEEELLGRPRVDDLPGSEAPERYRQFLRNGDAALLAPVLTHNQLDLLSLIRLINHLEQHLELARPRPSDWYSLGRFAEARGNLQRADSLYRGAESESPPPLDRAAALRRTRMLRRQGRDDEARAAWRSIWERWRDPEAAEALCIELEHQVGDLPAALALAQDALGNAPVGWDRRFAKRIWRLQSRLDSRDLTTRDLNQAASSGQGGPPDRPWASWLPGGNSYEAWLALRRGRRTRAAVAGGSRNANPEELPR